MGRILGIALLVGLIAAACGGSSPGNGTPGGSAPAGGGDIPGLSNVLFGTAYDPTSLAVSGKTATIKAGSPVVAVGRSLAPTPAADITVQLSAGGSNRPPMPVAATDNPDNAVLFAVDLTSQNLGPGTWIVSFVAGGRILASGYLKVTP